MELKSVDDKDELIITQLGTGGRATSRAKSERLRINLVDARSTLPSPMNSPLPSPLKLYADWSQALAIGTASPEETSIETNDGNTKESRPMTTETCDYDSLPPALRRKYFSTLERLRLAQDHASPSSKFGPLSGSYSVSVSARKPSPGKEKRPPYFARSSSQSIKKQDSRASKYFASQIDAEWFLSLPKKIQRKQFSREEQIMLGKKRENVILDAADEKLYRLGQQENRSSRSLRSNKSLKSKQAVSHRIEAMNAPGKPPDIDMKELVSDSFRWLEDDDEIDLTLDNYHTNVIPSTGPPPNHPIGLKRRPSFRRTFSLSSITFGRGLATPQKLAQLDFSRRTSVSLTTPFAERTNPIGSAPTVATHPEGQQDSKAIDPSAKHYQDPEARRKLRVYLASPQKFDEAVEFGFPSLRTRHTQPANTNLSPSENTIGANNAISRSFFDEDDVNSVPDGGGLQASQDDVSIADSDSPKTPEDTNQHGELPTNPMPKVSKKSADHSSTTSRPRVTGTHSEPYAQLPLADREMTLHMTLTRPDLRTVSERHDTPNKMPLSLAELPIADEAVTAWDTLPTSSGKVKKMWKRLTKK